MKKILLLIIIISASSMTAFAQKKEQKQVEALTEQINQLQAENAKLQAENEALKDSLTELQAKYDELQPYAEEYRMTKLFNEKPYLEKKYSEMEYNHLKQMKLALQPYIADSKVKEFVEEVDAAIANLQIYKKAEYAISVIYDKNLIDEARDRILALKGKVNKQQWIELYDEQDAYLSRYDNAIELLKQLFDKANQEVAPYRETENAEKSLCYDTIMEVLNEEQTQKDIERYISHVPYMKNLYDQYLADIKKDARKHSAVEDDKVFTVEL